MSMIRSALAAAICAASFAVAPGALASGSYGGGGGGGSFNREPVVRDPVQEAYNRGRSVFRRELTCKNDCPFAGGIEDRTAALAVMERVRAGEFDLSERQVADLVVYMDRRFRLSQGE